MRSLQSKFAEEQSVKTKLGDNKNEEVAEGCLRWTGLGIGNVQFGEVAAEYIEFEIGLSSQLALEVSENLRQDAKEAD